MRKRVLSLLLAIVMLVGMLPTSAIGASDNTARADAVAALAEQYGEENAEQMFDTMFSMGLIDQNGNPKTYKIKMDGKSYTLEEIRPFVEGEEADLTKTVTVDGDTVELSFIKKLLDYQDEMAYLEDFFTRQTEELTNEQQLALSTMVTQFANDGVSLRAAEDMLPVVTGVKTTMNGYGVDINLEFAEGATTEQLKKVTCQYVLLDGEYNVADLTRVNRGSYISFDPDKHDRLHGYYPADDPQMSGIQYYYTWQTVSANFKVPPQGWVLPAGVQYSGDRNFYIYLYDLQYAVFEDGSDSKTYPVKVDSGTADFEAYQDTSFFPIGDPTNALLDGSSFNVNQQGKYVGENYQYYALLANNTNVIPLNIKDVHRQAILNNTASHIVVKVDTQYIDQLQFAVSNSRDINYLYKNGFTQKGATFTGGSEATIPISGILGNSDSEDYKFLTSSTAGGGGQLFLSMRCNTKNWGVLTVGNNSTYYVKLVDLVAPTVTEVKSPDYVFPVGAQVPISVTFSEPVRKSTISLTMSDGTVLSDTSSTAVDSRVSFLYTVTDPNAIFSVDKVSGAIDTGDNKMADFTVTDKTAQKARPDYNDFDSFVSVTLSDSKGVEKTAFLPGETVNFKVELYEDSTIISNNETKGQQQNKWLTENTTPTDDGRFTVNGLYASADGYQENMPPVYINDEGTALSGSFTAPAAAGANRLAFFHDTGRTVDDWYIYFPGLESSDNKIAPIWRGTACASFTVSEPIAVAAEDITFAEPAYPVSPRTLVLGETTGLKLGYTVNPGSDATFTKPEDFFWKSSNEAILKIDEAGLLIPMGLGKANISLVAKNGSEESAKHTEVLVGEFTVKASNNNAVSIPDHKIKKGEAFTLNISANIVDENLYTDTKVKIYEGKTAEGTLVYETSVADKTVTTFAIPADKLTALSKGFAPAYTVQVEMGGIIAQGNVIVKSLPAAIKLNRPGTYFLLDSAGNQTITWTSENLDNPAAEITVVKNGEVIKTVTDTSGSISVPVSSLTDLHDVYTVNAKIKNAEDESWSYDSYVFYIYNSSALQIAVDGVTAGSSHTMDNNPAISKMSQDDIIALARKIDLTDDLSVNFKDYAYGIVSDQVLWKSSSASVAAMNYIRGGVSRELSEYDNVYTREDGTKYTEQVSYAPNTVFKLAGLNDGTTTITATHKFSQMTDTLGVTVNTLKDKLYLFQVQPKAETTATYTNGKGETKTVTSDATGAFAIYEESGIKSDLGFKSEFGGTTYMGTLYHHALVSGEKDATKGELYPINNFELRKVAEVNFNFQVPAFEGYQNNGGSMKPFIGTVTLRGGVYKNGNLCEGTVYGTDKPLTIDLNAGTRGMYTLGFDATKFWSSAAGETSAAELLPSDKIEYIFEVKYLQTGETDKVDQEQGKKYLPAILKFSGNYSYQDAMMMGEATTAIRPINSMNSTPSDAAKPFLMKQETNRFKPSGNLDDVTFSRGNIGISKQTPKIELISTVLWWGEEANAKWEKLTLKTLNERKLEVPGQTARTFKYPFSTIPVTESRFTLTTDNIWVKNDTEKGYLINWFYNQSGTVVKSVNSPFAVRNMMGVNNIANTSELNETFRDEMIQSVFAESSVPVDDKIIGKALQFAGSIDFSGENFAMLISPTEDPTVFDALIQLSMGEDPTAELPGVSEDGFSSVLFDEAAHQYENEVVTKARNAKNAINEVKGMVEGLSEDAADAPELKYQVAGLLKARVVYDFENMQWTVQPVGGGIDLGAGIEFGVSIPITLAPVIPVQVGFVDLDMGASVGMSYRMQMLTSPQSVTYSDYVNSATDILRQGTGTPTETANVSMGGTIDYDWAYKKSDYVVDNLTNLKLSAFIEVFAGLGFDYTVIALKIGPFGGVGLQNENTFLSRNYLQQNIADADAPYRNTGFKGGQTGGMTTGKQTEKALNGTYLNMEGHVGIKFEATLLCFSYTKVFASIGFDNEWTFRNWDKIAEYWEQTTGEELIYSSAGADSSRVRMAAMAYAAKTGEMAMYDGGSGLQNRDYLSQYTRVWHDDTERSGISLFSLDMDGDAPKYIQENAYPYSQPQVADDGSFFVYLKDSASVFATRAAVSMKGSGGYAEGTVIDDEGFGDSALAFDGDEAFAAAAWVRLTEEPAFADENAPTMVEQSAVMNGSEIYASIRKDDAWSTTRLTTNTTPETNPVIAVSGDKAIAAWKAVYAPNPEKPTEFDGNELLVYRIYDGSKWGEEKTLYNAEANGGIVGLSATMMDDGTAAVAYAFNGGADSSKEIVCAVLGADGAVKTSTRLTNDSCTDENPQLTVVNFGTSTPDWRFVLGWNRSDSKGSDVRLAVFDAEGNLKDDLGDSLYDMSGTAISAPFTFAEMDGTFRTLDNLTVIWAESQSEDEKIGSDKLKAVQFTVDGDQVYTSAAMPLADLPQSDTTHVINDQVDSYVSANNQVKSLILATCYDSANATSVVVDAVDPMTGAATTEEVSVPGTRSDIYAATQEFVNAAEITDATFVPTEIRSGFDLPVSFTVKNTGMTVLNEAVIQLAGSDRTVSDLNLYPGQSKTVSLIYTVPETVTDISYAGGTASFKGGETADMIGSGTLALAVPDVGISKAQIDTEQDGVRTVSVSLYNSAAYKLSGSGKTVKVGLYSSSGYEPAYQKALITLTADELALLDAGAYTASLSMKLDEFLTVDGVQKEIPDGGLPFFLKAWVEDSGAEVSEYNPNNNVSSVLFENLQNKNEGKSVKINLTQSVEDGKSIANLTLSSTIMAQQENGNVAVNLLNAAGEVIETQWLSSDPITLGSEALVQKSFAFAAQGASVEANYFTMSSADADNTLSMLELRGVPFTFDKDTLTYTVTAADGQTVANLTAVPSNLNATVSINADAAVAGIRTKEVTLKNGSEIAITVTPAVGDKAQTYTVKVVSNNTIPSGDKDTSPSIYAVKAEAVQNGAIAINPQSAAAGTKVAVTATPNEGYVVDTVQVIDAKGNTVAVTKNDNGSYSFTMPAASVTVRAAFKLAELTWNNPFIDVEQGQWYYSAVSYASQAGLFSGTSANTFTPNAPMTRAMLWTVLARQAGQDVSGGASWYEKAQAWAIETSVSDGTNPTGEITREQLVTMLWRQAGSPVLMDYPGLTIFDDVGDIAPYAQDSMAWAHQKGLVEGSGNQLMPKQSATRAQVAAIMMRYCENDAK